MKYQSLEYSFLWAYSWLSRASVFFQLVTYLKTGQPPEIYKRKIIKRILDSHEFLNAVETGTYFGRTAKLLSKYINNVYSIELSPRLHNFVNKRYRKLNIDFLCGHSEDLIKVVLKRINGATIFYLDSHASGGLTTRGPKVSSLKEELHSMNEFEFLNESLLLIDDAKSITGNNDYPDQAFLFDFAKRHNMKVYRNLADFYIIAGEDIRLSNNIITRE